MQKRFPIQRCYNFNRNLFTTSCSGSDTRPPVHPTANGYLGPVLGMVEVVNLIMVSNQITGARSTAPASFPRLPLPLIDRATDAPREKLQSLCAIWGESHGPHSQPKKITHANKIFSKMIYNKIVGGSSLREIRKRLHITSFTFSGEAR